MRVREHREELVLRLPVLRVVFSTLLVLVGGAYWFVQVVHGDFYLDLAENNRLRKYPLNAPRGLIRDRVGRLLVRNIPSYDLLMARDLSTDVQGSLTFAAKTLDLPFEELEAVLRSGKSKNQFRPTLLAEDLSLSQVAKFLAQALGHPEFEIEVGHRRLNVQGPNTAHFLGYLREVSAADLARPGTSYRAGDLIGRTGIEEAFDARLRGRDGERVVTVDSRGRPRRETRSKLALPGEDLTLTLDLELQEEAARYFIGRVGAVVALDPKSGEVLTLYSAPSYDPNLFSRRLDYAEWQELLADANHPLQNRSIQSTYSPGSIFKIVVALAGLGEGVIDPAETVRCTGSTKIYGRRFRCWKRAGHGRVNLHKAIKESCDIYFYYLGQTLGIERIARYARILGLGQKVNLDIAGEKAGLIPDIKWKLRARGEPWYPGETISVAIGQGPVLVTPIQLAAMMSTIANGGYRVLPHGLMGSGKTATQPIDLNPAHLARVKRALWSVVNEGGTGASAFVEGLDVAGKTSTVQVIEQKTWVNNRDLPFKQRDHAWFVSFATLGERQLAVAVFVEHGGAGSRVAAPLAKNLYEIYFRDQLALLSP